MGIKIYISALMTISTNNMKKQLLYTFMVIVLIYMSSCHKCTDPTNPYCPNYNPCLGKHATSAAFQILETAPSSVGTYIHWIPFPVRDTTSYDPVFQAEDSFAQGYTWIVGGGTYTGHSALSLHGYPRNQWITVTLIVKHTPDQQCFPNDDGLDTVTKQFIIVNFSSNPFEHTFRGVLDEDKTDSFNVTFNFHVVCPPFTYTSPNDTTMSFFNGKQNCTDTLKEGSIGGLSMNEFLYEDYNPYARCINKPMGRAILDTLNRNKITYEYNSYYSYAPGVANHVFRGYRIN